MNNLHISYTITKRVSFILYHFIFHISYFSSETSGETDPRTVPPEVGIPGVVGPWGVHIPETLDLVAE